MKWAATLIARTACVLLHDVLMPNWSLSHPAAFDVKNIHPLNSANILEVSESTAEKGGGEGKHRKNDDACNVRESHISKLLAHFFWIKKWSTSAILVPVHGIFYDVRKKPHHRHK